ncbi:hypothetical protein BpHYR1_014402 [Brachionus plicatilis]|uniref:Uncharacterized protein n=1 Tax=Brachionus plicatilis TaxID=10195 RepID=A0A3M7QBH1_BRAPC|nr:hypothetical protein BpHYR1_014402 [Brachionus plicatilis]
MFINRATKLAFFVTKAFLKINYRHNRFLFIFYYQLSKYHSFNRILIFESGTCQNYDLRFLMSFISRFLLKSEFVCKNDILIKISCTMLAVSYLINKMIKMSFFLNDVNTVFCTRDNKLPIVPFAKFCSLDHYYQGQNFFIGILI